MLTVTADEASAVYVRPIARTATRVGVDCEVHDVSPAEIRERLGKLSADPTVHGMILQTLQPAGL